MITCDFRGGLGNRIFQYVSARLLAERLNYSYESGCPLDGVLTPMPLHPGSKYIKNKIQVDESLSTENIFKMKWGKQHIHLHGYFQVSDYYNCNRRKILRFFHERATNNPDTENIVMHVRLTDYKIFGKYGNVLNPEYYLSCLEKETFSKLYIVTDAPNDSYLDCFKKYKPILSNNNLSEDFWLLTKFSRIIIANSTFSWWPAFLSNAHKIYTPKCWLRIINNTPHKLTIIDNGKCKCIPVENSFLDYK
jgi:hypothetical protein